MNNIDHFRKFLLTASLALLTIPGFAGFEMALAGVRLGRFQPFKFIFIGWMIFQAAWVFKQGRTHLRMPSPRARCLWLGVILLDLFLFIGLKVEGGQGRGWSIYFALLMGQTAAVLTVLDPNFPVRSMLRGFQIATLILVIFSIMELVFPTHQFTHDFLALVRDSRAISYQLGSSMSTVALGEFIARTLPLILLFAFTSKITFLAVIGLFAMGMLTLEKSTALSMFAVLVAMFLLGYGRHYLKWIAGVVTLGLVIVLIIQSPEQVLGRYIGMFLPKHTSAFNANAHQSVSERKEFWKQAGSVISEEPLTGIGLDGFAYRYQNRIPPVKDAVYPEASHVHNLFLELGVAGGAGALLSAVMIFLSYLFSGRSRPVAILYGASMFVSAMVDARIYVSWFAITLFWLGAMAWTVDRQKISSSALGSA